MICIIDDDEAVCGSLKLLIELGGFEACAFDSGPLFLAQQGSIHGLILDEYMPEMSGLEILEILRRRGSQIPAIIVTGRPSAAIRARARALGAFAILEKPFPPEDLLALVRRMVTH
jgi:two-component system, LuxR family, response regulator FixJ